MVIDATAIENIPENLFKSKNDGSAINLSNSYLLFEIKTCCCGCRRRCSGIPALRFF